MITEAKKRDVALVVDDSPETLRLLTDALDGAGMSAVVLWLMSGPSVW